MPLLLVEALVEAGMPLLHVEAGMPLLLVVNGVSKWASRQQRSDLCLQCYCR
jgi:hypothetical protein